MNASCTRLIAALALILPAAAVVSAPVMAATSSKKPHHVSAHKVSHKTASHHKKATSVAS